MDERLEKLVPCNDLYIVLSGDLLLAHYTDKEEALEAVNAFKSIFDNIIIKTYRFGYTINDNQQLKIPRIKK